LGKEMNENELVRRAVIKPVEPTHFRPVLSNIDFKILIFVNLKTTCGVVWCVLSRKGLFVEKYRFHIFFFNFPLSKTTNPTVTYN